MYTGPRIVRDGLVFCWDGTNTKSWNGTDNTHLDLANRASGEKQGASTLSLDSDGVRFNSNYTSFNCYIRFPNSGLTVPTGEQGTWLWTHYFIDSGSVDHPIIGKETSNGWNGVNGFVIGTGWGTDGLRVGIGGTAYSIFAGNQSASGTVKINTWQTYAITYTKNSPSGLKTYLYDNLGYRLVDVTTTPDVNIGSSSNELRIGTTNLRGGNWNGYINNVYMWNRALTSEEVTTMVYTLKRKY